MEDKEIYTSEEVYEMLSEEFPGFREAYEKLRKERSDQGASDTESSGSQFS